MFIIEALGYSNKPTKRHKLSAPKTLTKRSDKTKETAKQQTKARKQLVITSEIKTYCTSVQQKPEEQENDDVYEEDVYM